MDDKTRSVDDLLIKVQHEQLTGTAEPKPPIEPQINPEIAAVDNTSTPDDHIDENQEPGKDVLRETPETPDSPDSGTTGNTGNKGNIDEYGNPVEKAKTYTEEEVQALIRDRLSRGRYAEQPPIPQPQQPPKQLDAEPGQESWQQELEQFIDQTIERRQTKQAEQQWRQQEAQKQAAFESKFSTQMQKYPDFHQVVAGKPITDSMMLATRNLDNPAAFVYGAAKMHPQELERIARINDPYVQAAEVGRLHEKMVKARNATTAAPKPLEPVKGDMGIKHSQLSIDERIHQHARQRFGKK